MAWSSNKRIEKDLQEQCSREQLEEAGREVEEEMGKYV
jgi:hypothetical protein